jgi:hypothetical protein
MATQSVRGHNYFHNPNFKPVLYAAAEDVIGGERGTHGRGENAYDILPEKPEQKRQTTWKSLSFMGGQYQNGSYRSRVGRYGLDSSGSR